MNPYDTLKIPVLAPLNVAKAAWRRLSQKYHPDREGGDEEKFKEIQTALNMIEAGWRPPASPPPAAAPATSSAFDARPQKPAAKAGRPAPGYEARNTPPPVPHATKIGKYGSDYTVTLTITQKQAFEGCVVPFYAGRTTCEYVVRPGNGLMGHTHYEAMSFPVEQIIGQGRPGEMVNVKITLNIIPDKPTHQAPPKPAPQPTGPLHISVKLCALGLFIGGRVTVLDHLNEKVSIVLPAGYDPTKPFKVEGKGLGEVERGDMFITIIPIFKEPSALSTGERAQLKQLNEMAG